jgi:DnaJ-class molecular chaperone
MNTTAWAAIIVAVILLVLYLMFLRWSIKNRCKACQGKGGFYIWGGTRKVICTRCEGMGIILNKK